MSDRPFLLPPVFDAFPSELTERAQWVLWRGIWQPAKRKYSKVPYQPNGQKASSTDPATWSGFPTVKAAYEQGGFDGVGFVLSENDPLSGVDFDHAIVDGEVIRPVAADLTLLDSYAEVSPSGEGVRVFVLANLPPGGRKTGDFECYDSGRFLTVTGRSLGITPETINHRQSEVEELHRRHFPTPATATPAKKKAAPPLAVDDNDLLSRATQAKNGAKIAALYSGDTSGYASRSEAEGALCCFLAFWTGPDQARLDRLFRNSSLMRDKWDEPHYANGDTYGARTVQTAIDGTANTFDWVGAERTTRMWDWVKSDPLSDSTPSDDEPEESIPAAKLRNERGQAEYAPFQIAEILCLEAESPSSHRALAYRAVRANRGDLLWCRELGWLLWDGKRWKRDDKDGSATAALFVRLSHQVREESARLFRLASDLAKGGRPDDADAMARAARVHLAHVKKVEDKTFAEASMLLARSALSVDVGQFEPRPWVIGFENGVWDRGCWREHQREDYLLELCPVQVNLKADFLEWEAVLSRITRGDEDFAHTLQDIVGYALSGASHLRTIPWLYGLKGTGKSTFAELTMTLLGYCAGTVDPKKLQDHSARERLGVDLWGKRLVVCSEAGNQRLGVEALKTLSGSDRYPVRFLYKEAFTAKPTHLLVMVANDAPNMDAYDDALKDRVIALPFHNRLSHPEPLRFADGARIEAVRQNPDSTLLRGFASWAMAGLSRLYNTQEIYLAPCVETATRRFWEDVDPLTEFWAEIAREIPTLFVGRDGRPYIARSELRGRYDSWCGRAGVKRPLSPQRWTQACQVKGLQEGHDAKAVRVWRFPADAETWADSCLGDYEGPPAPRTAELDWSTSDDDDPFADGAEEGGG